MREFVEFVAYGERMVRIGSPPGWPETSPWRRCVPSAPKSLIDAWPVPDSWPHGVTIRIRLLPGGFRDDPGPAPAPPQGPQQITCLVQVRCEYTAAERRRAELLILGGGRIVSSVEGTLRWEEVSICPFCELPDG